MTALSPHEIEERLVALPGWTMKDDRLARTFEFPDFLGSIRFVNLVAASAEELGHHPDIDIRYNKVSLGLVTHDAGGVTDKDFVLAATANKLA